MSTYSDIQDLKSSLFDAELVSALADTFKVLGDATRVRILDVLSRDELCVGDIADILGLSESAVSHQLRLLRGQSISKQEMPNGPVDRQLVHEDAPILANKPVFTIDPTKPYAHPYYWAPFILIGNWK